MLINPMVRNRDESQIKIESRSANIKCIKETASRFGWWISRPQSKQPDRNPSSHPNHQHTDKMRFIRALQTVAVLAASTTVMGWNRLDKEKAVFPFCSCPRFFGY
jgi:hypothetical protein